MKDRIKQIRKATGLNQTEFGARVGVKGNTIGNYELGLRNPSDAVIFSICREFGVDEVWLRTGKGEMFVQLSDDEEFLQIMTDIQVSDDPFIRSILKAYWLLSDEKKAVIREFVDSIQTKEKAGN